MDIGNENGDADHASPQPPSQQPNGLQNEDPSGSQVESHPDTPADGHPVSQPTSQPATQSNDTPNAQANGHPGTQTPPCGQGNPMEEEPIDPKDLLEPFGWGDLEERFAQKMEECQRHEAEIENEFREWCLPSMGINDSRTRGGEITQAGCWRSWGKTKDGESNYVIDGRAKDEASDLFNEMDIHHDDEKVQEELMVVEEEKAMDDEHELDELIIAEEERGIGFHRARCVVS
ncbi:MAG: hypothetical protein L6R42_008717 [Xanthoria sp. 1 TBL-2021]|nr:MAG: hypothetical protein L6R42_008717 [Xanthoria sp. 1 TBL-2021]